MPFLTDAIWRGDVSYFVLVPQQIEEECQRILPVPNHCSACNII